MDARRKKMDNEQLYKLLLDYSPDYIMLVDRHYTIQFMNRVASGFNIEEVTGGNLYDYVPTDAQHEHKRMLDAAFENGDIGALAVPVLAGDTTTWYEVRFVPVRDGAEIPSVMLIGSDITTRTLAEEEREQLIIRLRKALAEIKTLSGLLPICAMCHKIRDDKGYWHRVDMYLHKYSDATISHGYCPDCYKRMNNEIDGSDNSKGDKLIQPEDPPDSE